MLGPRSRADLVPPEVELDPEKGRRALPERRRGSGGALRSAGGALNPSSSWRTWRAAWARAIYHKTPQTPLVRGRRNRGGLAGDMAVVVKSCSGFLRQQVLNRWVACSLRAQGAACSPAAHSRGRPTEAPWRC